MPTTQELTAAPSAVATHPPVAVQPKVSDDDFYDGVKVRLVPKNIGLKQRLTAFASIGFLSLIGAFAGGTKAQAQQVACDEYGQCYVSVVTCDYYGYCWQQWYPYSSPSSYSDRSSYSSQGSICDTYQVGSTWDYICNPNSRYRRINDALRQPNIR